MIRLTYSKGGVFLKKFYVFNAVVFLILFILFIRSFSLENTVLYSFAGGSIVNPIDGETRMYAGLALQIFSGLGMLIQLILVNVALLKQQEIVVTE